MPAVMVSPWNSRSTPNYRRRTSTGLPPGTGRSSAWNRYSTGTSRSRQGTTQFESELLYDTGTAKFGVYESWAAGRNEATAARLVVTDFDTAFAELKANGVVFEDYDYDDDFRTINGVLRSPDGEKTAWFKDSEGNILAIRFGLRAFNGPLRLADNSTAPSPMVRKCHQRRMNQSRFRRGSQPRGSAPWVVCPLACIGVLWAEPT